MKNFLSRLTLLAFFLISPLAVAADLVEKVDFDRIQPAQNTESPGKIEVLEFFSFACPHCKDINPVATAWAAKLPKDVVFRRVPVSGNRAYTNLAKIYYALEITGDLSRLDGDIFAALHTQKINLVDEAVATDWLVKKGVDKAKFSDAYKSFGIDSMVKRAQKLAEAYKIQGVPSFAIDGRYRLINENAGSHEALLAKADLLIQKVRAENSKKK